LSSITKNIEKLENELKPYQAQLIAVSKTKPVSDIMEAYEQGFRDFGENKVQELSQKAETMPQDIQWHMIGHLQRNKVKYIAPFVYLIHSIDSLKLLQEVDKQGKRVGRRLQCLLQIHIAEESTKFGLSGEELIELLQSEALMKMDHIQISGLMGMATFTPNESQIRKEFKSLKVLFDKASEFNEQERIQIDILSMGMSNDYKIALEEGSTMIRVGSSIFGSRNYA